MKFSLLKGCVYILLFAGLAPGKLIAQQHTGRDSVERKILRSGSFSRVSLSYSSDFAYAGRKDSIALPYGLLSLGYYHKSGWFAQGFLSYLTASKEKRVDMGGLTAGYIYLPGRFYGGISGTAWFYNDSSYSVQSETGGNIYAFAGYDFHVIDLSIDATTLFGGSMDFLSGIELSRMFFMANDQFKLTPTIYTQFGTQNYYSEYYTYRRSGSSHRGRGPGGGGMGGSGNEGTMGNQEATKFQLLAFEFSLPAMYSAGKFRFYFIPTYIIPQSPSTLTTSMGTETENLENIFIWSIGASFNF